MALASSAIRLLRCAATRRVRSLLAPPATLGQQSRCASRLALAARPAPALGSHAAAWRTGGGRGVGDSGEQRSGFARSPVRSFEISGPGAVDSPLMASMRQKISEALSTDQVLVQDINGDGRHVSIKVVSEVFEGKRSLDRQRLVYRAIWEELQGAVHAVDSLTTLTPSELTEG